MGASLDLVRAECLNRVIEHDARNVAVRLPDRLNAARHFREGAVRIGQRDDSALLEEDRRRARYWMSNYRNPRRR